MSDRLIERKQALKFSKPTAFIIVCPHFLRIVLLGFVFGAPKPRRNVAMCSVSVFIHWLQSCVNFYLSDDYILSQFLLYISPPFTTIITVLFMFCTISPSIAFASFFSIKNGLKSLIYDQNKVFILRPEEFLQKIQNQILRVCNLQRVERLSS